MAATHIFQNDAIECSQELVIMIVLGYLMSPRIQSNEYLNATLSTFMNGYEDKGKEEEEQKKKIKKEEKEPRTKSPQAKIPKFSSNKTDEECTVKERIEVF